MKKKLEELRSEYKAEIKRIEAELPEREKWGSGKFYRHRRAILSEFVERLGDILQEAEK